MVQLSDSPAVQRGTGWLVALSIHRSGDAIAKPRPRSTPSLDRLASLNGIGRGQLIGRSGGNFNHLVRGVDRLDTDKTFIGLIF